MERKDRKSKKAFKKKYNKKDMKQYVTKNQLDVILDRQIEDKFIDNSLVQIFLQDAVTANPNRVQELSVVAEGTGPSELVGLRTKPKALYMRFHFFGNPTGNNNNQSTIIRVIVFQWHLDASDQPNTDDILQVPPLTMAGQPLAYNNIGNSNKYTIIYNNIVDLANADQSSKFIQQDEFYYQFSKRQRHNLYDNAGAATTGHFFLLWFSDKLIADAPVATYVARYRYEDA